MLVFSSLNANLSAKMFRIWRLSDVKSLEIRVIKDIHLVPLVAGIAVLYIVPLAVWTVLDPPRLHPYTTNLPPDQYLMICGTGATGVTSSFFYWHSTAPCYWSVWGSAYPTETFEPF
eukprot:TRINITY_DN4723_c0_g1_i1.p1 TRINITY_DN4723_c0_g1~~TRINITY_DN4723_c0_g1_i1.p1  ORF type:complete len:117 (+),score=13.19 TRINITY_DN4723_c0_g1_i1:47-397(+)